MKLNEDLANETTKQVTGLIDAYAELLCKSKGVPQSLVHTYIHQQLSFVGPKSSDLRDAWNKILDVMDNGFSAQLMAQED